MVIHEIGFQENSTILLDPAIRAYFVISRSTVQIRPQLAESLNLTQIRGFCFGHEGRLRGLSRSVGEV